MLSPIAAILLIVGAGFLGALVGAGLMMFVLVKSANDEVRWNKTSHEHTKLMTKVILQHQIGGKGNRQEIIE